jgi:hypothetical protein
MVLYRMFFCGLLIQKCFADLTEVYLGLNNNTKPKSLEPGGNDLIVGDQFGHAVAVWGSRCIVSATRRVLIDSGHPQTDGVVYVFNQNDEREWQDAGYTLSSFVDGDGYGESLAIFETTAAVGAPRDDSSGANSGRAYVYYESSGTGVLDRSQVLYADHAQAYDYFGFSVAVLPGDGYYPAGTVVVGAYGHTYQQREHKIEEAGCVFVFPYSGDAWFMSVVLQPSQPYENGFFGWAVSGYGNAIAVGAPGQEAVYVFRLEPIRRECPHDGKPEELPEDCREQHHRRLQAGAPPGHMYTSWEYMEVLHVQNDLQNYNGDMFGQSVSVINETALTVVVGAPSDNDKGSAAGAIYVLTLLPSSDIWSTWSPDHPDGDHSHQHGHLRRTLQGAPPSDEHQGDEHRMNIWNIRSYSYSSDKDGRAWMMMAKMYGKEANEFYGYCTAVSDSHILVGVFGGPYKKGRAELLVFNSSKSVDTNSPIFQGPLYQMKWMKESVLTDSSGGQGDYFGSAVGLYEGIAVVGGFLTGFTSNSNIGTGAAYIYDATSLMSLTSSNSLSESHGGGSLARVGKVVLLVGEITIVCAVLAAIGAAIMYKSEPFVSSFWRGSGGKGNSDSYMDVTQSSSVDESISGHPLRSSSRGSRYSRSERGSGSDKERMAHHSSSRRPEDHDAGREGRKISRDSSHSHRRHAEDECAEEVSRRGDRGTAESSSHDRRRSRSGGHSEKSPSSNSGGSPRGKYSSRLSRAV